MFTSTGFVKAAALVMVLFGSLVSYQVYNVRQENYLRQLITAGDPLRVAVFGSSQSWGAVLKDRFDAYPYRLSPRVDNFAYFSSGPNYPAVCAQSVIGDKAVYDLILLEYYVNGAENGLADLARRLRERFPKAIIIVMKFYGPFDAVRKESPSDAGGMSLSEWKQTLNLPRGSLNDLVKAVEQDTGYWKFREHPNTDRAINKVVREIGGYQFHLPTADEPQKRLVNYLRFFDKDTNQHLHERGHAWVADMCQKIVKRHLLKGKGKLISQVDRATVGTWGRGDSCNIWKTTGAMTLPFSTDSAKVTQYDTKRGKFAMEFTSDSYVDVENTFKDERTLYLSFIASSATGSYPKVDAVIGGINTELDPNTDASKDKQGVGVIRTVAVGKVPGAQVTRVELKPTEVGTPLPFRLVGVTFTNEEVTPVEFGFGPNFNK